MRPFSRRGVLALMAVALTGCITPEPPDEGTARFYARLDQAGTLDEAAALAMINAYRARDGLAALVLDPALVDAARRLAAGIAAADTSTWGETPTVTPSSGMLEPERLERVSAGYRTLAEAFSGWRYSPPHNRVLLAPWARRIGIAAVDRPGTKYRVYWGLIVAGGQGG